MQLNELFLKHVLADVSIEYASFVQNPHFVVDSRAVQKGDIFIALKGSGVDGHDFIKDAIDRGASGLMIAKEKKECLAGIEKKFLESVSVMCVDDPQTALIKLAKEWRQQFHYPVIAITGSMGKTSTKDTLAQILLQAGKKCVVSYGNQNTQIGIPLNILKMRHEHEVAVFELGISARGEMKNLVDIVKPTHAVITSIGHCHMQGLGSLQDIAVEKRNIFAHFKHDSIGVINGDIPVLANVSYHHPVVKFGQKTTNQVQARKISISSSGMSFILKLYDKKYPIMLNCPQVGAVHHILAAASIAYLLKIPDEAIMQGVQKRLVVPGRFEKRNFKKYDGELINDAYNANPESLKAALTAFEQIKTQAQKIAVIGDMLELGANAPFWHRQIGRFLRKVPSLKHLILVGSMVKWTKKTMPVGIQVEIVQNWQEALQKLEPQLETKSLVLVKGSRGIGLDNLVGALT